MTDYDYMARWQQVEVLIERLVMRDYPADADISLEDRLLGFGESAVPPILHALTREDIDGAAAVRLAALLADLLSKQGALRHLRWLLVHPESGVRWLAVDRLAKADVLRYEPELRLMLDDPSRGVRDLAAEALAEGDAVAALDDVHPHVRYRAVRLLERRHELEGLLAALERPDNPVRRVAVRFAGRHRWHEAVPHLLALLDTEARAGLDHETMKATIRALGMIGDARALTQLRDLLTHNDPVIRRMAHAAVRQLTR